MRLPLGDGGEATSEPGPEREHLPWATWDRSLREGTPLEGLSHLTQAT